MAKLTYAQTEQFHNACEWMSDLKMSVLFSRELRMMVGIRPETDNGHIYRMYVTLCHKKDKFKKKLGAIALCEKMDNDNYIQFRAKSFSAAVVFMIQHMHAFANGFEFTAEELELN